MKRRAWKWLLGTLGAMALVTGAVVVDVHRRASATFRAQESEIAAKRDRIRTRDRSRPPFGGEPLPGNGWTAIVRAIDMLDAMPAESKAALPEVDAEVELWENPDDHLIHGVFSSQSAPLALLHEAARCRTIDRNYDYSPEASKAGVNPNHAGRFLLGLMNHQRRTGQQGESLRTAALGLAIAQDCGRDGPVICQMIQWVNEVRIGDELRGAFRNGHSFSAGDLEQFARSLDALDPHRPRIADYWVAEDLAVRLILTQADWHTIASPYQVSMAPTWRCFYSQRITRAQAVNVWATFSQKVERLFSLPHSRQIQELRRIEREYAEDSNPLVNAVTGFYWKVLQLEARSMMARVLLRVSTAIAWYEAEQGTPPITLKELVPRYLPAVPACPLTDLPLRYQSGRVWSLGANGVDDGGTLDENGFPTADEGDVVWVVQRK